MAIDVNSVYNENHIAAKHVSGEYNACKRVCDSDGKIMGKRAKNI